MATRTKRTDKTKARAPKPPKDEPYIKGTRGDFSLLVFPAETLGTSSEIAKCSGFTWSFYADAIFDIWNDNRFAETAKAHHSTNWRSSYGPSHIGLPIYYLVPNALARSITVPKSNEYGEVSP